MNECSISQKELETQNVMSYLDSIAHSVSISEILAKVKVDKLRRIYGIIIDLKTTGFLEVTRESVWGAPRAVKRIRLTKAL